jgi:hypothetical protein
MGEGNPVVKTRDKTSSGARFSTGATPGLTRVLPPVCATILCHERLRAVAKLGGIRNMNTPSDNETWIIDAGDPVIEKKASTGVSSLTARERLIYCLWVADYGMRNAGDLATARDLYPDFQREAVQLAAELSLPFTHESFSLAPTALERQYFERFDRICNELQGS